MATYRLAVLSDLHIDSEVEPDSWTLARRAFDAVAQQDADHVIIVGDIFDCASAMTRDRARVRKELKQHGLWHRDRLSIVVGNHDIFHTAHHGSKFQRGVELLKAATVRAQANYDAFCGWAGELVSARDRLRDDDLFPFVKHLEHVTVTALDTTERVTAASANARLPAGDARLVEAAAGEFGRHVLAVHHAPFEGQATVRESIQGKAGGYSAEGYSRLKALARSASVEAVVCGHIHDPGDDEYEWSLMRETPVYLVGRTGGVHDTTPTFGILSVPERGAVRWKTVEF